MLTVGGERQGVEEQVTVSYSAKLGCVVWPHIYEGQDDGFGVYVMPARRAC